MGDLSVSFFSFLSVHECYIPPNIVKSLPLTSSISTYACVWASVLNPVHWASFGICSSHWALLTALGHARYVSVVWLCVGISLNDDNLDLLEISTYQTQLYIISMVQYQYILWCNISLTSQAQPIASLVSSCCYQHLLQRTVFWLIRGWIHVTFWTPVRWSY